MAALREDAKEHKAVYMRKLRVNKYNVRNINDTVFFLIFAKTALSGEAMPWVGRILCE